MLDYDDWGCSWGRKHLPEVAWLCYLEFSVLYHWHGVLFLQSLSETLYTFTHPVYVLLVLVPLMTTYTVAKSRPCDPESSWNSRGMKVFARLVYSDWPIFIILSLALTLAVAEIFVFAWNDLPSIADATSPWGLMTFLWSKRRSYTPVVIYKPLRVVFEWVEAGEIWRLVTFPFRLLWVNFLRSICEGIVWAYSMAVSIFFYVTRLPKLRLWPNEEMQIAYRTKDPDSFYRTWDETTLGYARVEGRRRRFGPWFSTGTPRLPWGRTPW